VQIVPSSLDSTVGQRPTACRQPKVLANVDSHGNLSTADTAVVACQTAPAQGWACCACPEQPNIGVTFKDKLGHSCRNELRADYEETNAEKVEVGCMFVCEPSTLPCAASFVSFLITRTAF